MLRANVSTGNLSILLPMITSIEEIDEAKRLIDRAVREVEEVLGYEIPKSKIGVMLRDARSAVDDFPDPFFGYASKLYLDRHQ